MNKAIQVSELTHASLFLLQAKLMTSDKVKYSMDIILNKLLVFYDEYNIKSKNPLLAFKLENIET